MTATKRVIYGYYNRPPREPMLFTEPSMTQQQFLEESDLNNIVDKNMKLKDPAFLTKLQLAGKIRTEQPIYGDFTEMGSYQEAMNLVHSVDEQFLTLPSKIRDRFNNNPVELYNFVQDPSNYDECVSLGLFEKPVVEAPAPPADLSTIKDTVSDDSQASET